MVNLDQILSLLRAILAIVGTVLTTNGTISSSLWQQLTGVILMAAPIVWSMFVHSDSGKLTAVAAMPEVKQIVVTPAAPSTAAAAMAADVSTPKVVTSTKP